MKRWTITPVAPSPGGSWVVPGGLSPMTSWEPPVSLLLRPQVVLWGADVRNARGQTPVPRSQRKQAGLGAVDAAVRASPELPVGASCEGLILRWK